MPVVVAAVAQAAAATNIYTHGVYIPNINLRWAVLFRLPRWRRRRQPSQFYPCRVHSHSLSSASDGGTSSPLFFFVFPPFLSDPLSEPLSKPVARRQPGGQEGSNPSSLVPTGKMTPIFLFCRLPFRPPTLESSEVRSSSSDVSGRIPVRGTRQGPKFRAPSAKEGLDRESQIRGSWQAAGHRTNLGPSEYLAATIHNMQLIGFLCTVGSGLVGGCGSGPLFVFFTSLVFVSRAAVLPPRLPSKSPTAFASASAAADAAATNITP